MKKILSWVLMLCIMLSAIPTAFVFASDEEFKVYYNSTGFDAKGQKPGSVDVKGNTISLKFEEEVDNRYMHMETLDPTTDYYWQFSIKEAERYMVFEMDFSTTGNIPGGSVTYKNLENTMTPALFSFGDNTITFLDGKTLDIKKGKWTNVQLIADFENFTYDVYSNGKRVTRDVPFKGDNSISRIRIHPGFENEVGTVLMVDNLKIYSGKELQEISNEPEVRAIRGEREDIIEGTPFKETDVCGDSVIYNTGGYDAINKISATKGDGNIVEIREDETGNRYLHCETVGGTQNFYWQIAPVVTRFTVFEMDLSTNGSLPSGNIQYKDMNSKAAGSILSFNTDNVIKFKNGTTTLEKGKWTNIAICIDFLTNKHAVYVDGKQIFKDVVLSASAPSMAQFRMYYSGGNTPGTAMLVDNFKVYEGEAPRSDVPDEFVKQYEKAKIDRTNDKGTKALGDVVALSVGGNGIYYGGEKHAIDAPAYIDNSRTLIPVRAVSEAFGLDVAWDADTRTVTVDGKSKIVIDSTEMILPDGSSYTLDVPAKITNNRTFIPLRALCEKILGKTVTWHERGIIVIDDEAFTIDDSNAQTINDYLLFDRPTNEQITERFNTYNKNTHPRILMDGARKEQVIYNYQNDPDVKKWGDKIISTADTQLKAAMPEYVLPDNYRLLATSRDVYNKARHLSMAYVLTGDSKYPDGLYKIFQAAGSFPDWNPQHFLDVAEMTFAFSIGYDWCYDYWTDEQKAYLEETIYKYGVSVMRDSQYSNLFVGGLGAGNKTNWNVVCNGGTIAGAIAIFDKHPEECADLISISLRDLESMMNTFYPDGAWDEGPGYWDYTIDYTKNLFATLDAALGTDFNILKAPGFSKTAFFHLASEGSQGTNNYHDGGITFGSDPSYMWISEIENQPDIARVRLFDLNVGNVSPSIYDILYYDTSIKGTDFTMAKDHYLRNVEFVSMRNSWTDDSAAYLSYHGGVGTCNHSHLDTGTFIFDLGGIRWAPDLGADDYNLTGYFGSEKHTYYRLRPEGHNVYVIDPDNKEGQVLDHFATVESLVSKERGAYSVLDMTPAYSKWVNKARRGYMLTDDRRSGIIRDEIEFNQEGREFWWFMNTPLNAEIEIVDKNTAYIKKDGLALKFMISSDIANYELGVMDAAPLPTSPNPAGQNKNSGYRKIYLKGTAGAVNYVECKMILADDVYASEPMLLTPIDQWTLPEGSIQEIPVLDSISVNGVALAEFNPTTTTYSRTLRYDDTTVANITATAAEGLKVEIIPGATYADPIAIKVSYENNPLLARMYYYTTNVLPKLDDIGDYTRHQVVGHEASDEPEANHPASNVSDNDIQPESRWAATDNAWLILDLGEVQEVDAIGVSAWKGDARAYAFKIEVSVDGVNWTEVIAERSTENSYGESIGIYPFETGAVNARYVRYSGGGNSVNNWNSLMEIAVLKKK